ncbi:DUF2231 domain-containing protein [Lysinibacillus capsici]
MSSPLHPMVIHFPIVMLILGIITLWISFWKPDFYGRISDYLLIGGTVLLIPAVASGLASVEYAKTHFSPSQELLQQHQMLGFVTLLIFVLTIIVLWIQKKRSTKALKGILMVLSLIGVILLIFTGKFGGQIVYP